MSESLLVSKREAAALLGVSIRTLENLIAVRELPVRRVGRRCLLERQALEKFARRDHSTTRPDSHNHSGTGKCAARVEPVAGSPLVPDETLTAQRKTKRQRKRNEDAGQSASVQPQS